jgi:hypothetical protein
MLPLEPRASGARGALVLGAGRGAFAVLEQLRGDRDRDRARLLPLDPRDPDRAGQARQPIGRDAEASQQPRCSDIPWIRDDEGMVTLMQARNATAFSASVRISTSNS